MAEFEDEEEEKVGVILICLLSNAITTINLDTFNMNIQRRSLTGKENYVEGREKILFMAYVNDKEASKEKLWLLTLDEAITYVARESFFRFLMRFQGECEPKT